MNHDTTGHIHWPHDTNPDRNDECSACFNELNEHEQKDPAIIDSRIFCDHCASEYIAFRCGTLRNVADMTSELVINAQPTPFDSIPMNTINPKICTK